MKNNTHKLQKGLIDENTVCIYCCKWNHILKGQGAIGRRIKINQGINYIESLMLGNCFSPGFAISNGTLISDA